MPLDVGQAGAWSTAVPDWEARILAGRSLIPDLPLFEAERDRAVRIFDRLRVPDVEDQPPMAEAAGDWLREIVATLFGSYDAEARQRMVQELFLLVPKKNGKSTGAAAIMVVAMLMNRRPNAEFLLVAPTKEIAAISYNQARDMILADEELAKAFHRPQDHIRTIRHRRSKAVLKIKAADTDAITGSKSTGILVDETHEFATRSNASAVFVEIRGALAARPDGFMIQITTQSKDPPAGVFAAELATARAVRDGEISLPRLAILYELPRAMQMAGRWRDRSTWGLVNPNLGRSVRADFLANELLVAEREGPAKLALLASQHFNVEVGVGLKASTWIGAEHWPGAALAEGLTLDDLIDRCEVAVAGVDGGGLDDLYAVAVIGREKATRRWLLWTRAWAHPEVLERRKEIAPALLDFAADGDLVLLTDDQPTGDVEGVADVIERLLVAGLLPEKAAVGLDPQGVAALVDELVDRGLTDEQLVAVGQGFRLSPAVWGMERKLKDGTLVHGGRRMMGWVLGNARTEQRGNAVYVTKEAAGKAKIDPLVAAFDAFILMSRNPGAARVESYLAEAPLMVL